MSGDRVIGRLTIDLDFSEAQALELLPLPMGNCDVGFENPRRVFFEAIPAEQTCPLDVQQPVVQPKTVGRDQGSERNCVVGAKNKGMLWLENPMDLIQAVIPFLFGEDIVYPVEGEKNIVEALVCELEVTGIHDCEINAINQFARLRDHLWNNVDARDGMSHSLEKKARSAAAAADVEDPGRNSKMHFKDSFLHGEEIKLAVLVQSLLMGKNFFVLLFLLGEVHRPLPPVLEMEAMLQDLSRFHKTSVGSNESTKRFRVRGQPFAP